MMTRKLKELRVKRRTRPGAPPGTLSENPAAVQSIIHVVEYGSDNIVERAQVSIDDIKTVKEALPVVWVHLSGLAGLETIKAIGKTFGLHDLALEDVVNVHQRPKAEEYSDHLFIVSRAIVAGESVETEQISVFVGADYVLSFEERLSNCFDPLRERLRRSNSRMRRSGPDYLAYSLIDTILDAYFPILEEYGERLETLEDAVVAQPGPEIIAQIHSIKRDLLSLRRAIWPHREMINELIREETPLVKDETRVYLRDCYDHVIQLMDIVETYREIASGLLDIYLSSMSTRLNDIMKVLTIIATLFIPLSFVASVYGMNFDRSVSPWNMPELSWRFGYPLVLVVMAGSATLLLAYFVRKGWIKPFWKR